MKRTWLFLLVALAALSGSLVAAFGTQALSEETFRGYTSAATDPNLPFSVPRLGVNADLGDLAPDDIARQLDRMRAAGIVWVRQRFDWSRMMDQDGGLSERNPYANALTALGHAQDLRVIAVLTDSSGEPPASAAFATFAGAFAARYGAVVDVYQVWDEPNLASAWAGRPEPAAYAALLSETYRSIHAHDISAVVLSAALAPTLETGPANISDILYLDALYRLGLRDFSDGIASKPYGFSSPPDAPANASALNFRRMVLLRDVMLAHDDAETGLWASEWGWNALPDAWQGEPSIWGQVTSQQRAEYTLTALRLAQAQYPWLAGMTLSDWQPTFAPLTSARWGFALIDSDDQPTPIYQELSSFTATLIHDGAPPGLHQAANADASYSGVWTLSDFGADIGWVGDSQADFRFTGSSVSLLVREGSYTGYLYITVDGQPANALPQDVDGNAYLLLTSDTLQPELRLVTVARGLSEGTHTLQLTADRGWDQWAIAGYGVGTNDPTEPYTRQVAITLLSAALSASAVIVFARPLAWSALFSRVSALLDGVSWLGGLALSGLASALLLIGMLLTWRDVVPDILRREPIQLVLALLTAGLLYVNPAFVLSAAAAGFLFIVFFHRPVYGLALTLGYAPLFLFPVELYNYAFPMSEVLVLLTFGAWALRTGVDWARQRRTLTAASRPLRWHLLDALLALYLMLGFLSLLWTEYPRLAWTELRTLFVEPLLFYIVFRSLRLSQRDLLLLVDGLVASAVIVALVGLFLYLRGQGVITAEDGARRLASVYGSPNNVALWLGRCLPFALAFAVMPVDRTRRTIAAGLTLLFLITVAATLSAGGLFVGLPAGIVAVLLAVYGRRILPWLLGISGVSLLALPALAQIPRFARLIDPNEGTNFFRVRVWQSALAILRDHPLTGIGQDQFLNFFRGRYILPDAWQEPNLSHPHNILLDVWLRLGIVGVLVVLAIVILACRSFWRVVRLWQRGDTSPIMAALAVGGLGAWVNLIAHGLIDNSIFVNDLVYVFVLLCGLAVWLSNERLT